MTGARAVAGVGVSDPVTITLAGVPVAKGRPLMTRAGHAYTPGKTRGAEAYLRMQAAQEMRGRLPLEGALELSMRAVLPIPPSWSKRRQAEALAGGVLPVGRPDLDNYAKLVADGLNGIVYRDDAAIISMHLAKVYGPQPCLIVTVRQVAA